MPQNYGLGRGLASLIPNKASASSAFPKRSQAVPPNHTLPPVEKKLLPAGVPEVDINLILPNPHQPRITFSEEKITELANSIKQHGIIQPLVVTQKGNNYELIAGERRLQAAKRAGLRTVPVVVREAEEKSKLELAVVENVQRHDLNPVEEAKAYQKLITDYQMHQDEVAQKVGKSRSAVANKLRILQLPVEIQRAIIEGKITEGHAKAILAVTSPEKQRALFELILKDNLTVRQVEDKTKTIEVKAHKRASKVDPELKALEEKLMAFFGTKVKVSRSGEGGKIVIDFYSQEDLSSLMAKLGA